MRITSSIPSSSAGTPAFCSGARSWISMSMSVSLVGQACGFARAGARHDEYSVVISGRLFARIDEEVVSDRQADREPGSGKGDAHRPENHGSDIAAANPPRSHGRYGGR